jgi:NADH:ubiquinone oxidoreductase subunit 6 (subunit J)
MTELNLFYMFSFFAILSGIMVIRAKNPVYSVLFLILVFCNAAGLLILIDLDFFAMVFLVVYVGAIAVLFLFVVMMLNIRLTEINENVLRYLPIGGLIGFIFLFEILLIIDQDMIPIVSFDTPNTISAFEILQYYITFLLLSICCLLISFPLYIFSFSEVLSQWSGKYSEISQKLDTLHTFPETYTYVYTEFVTWSNNIENITTIEALGQLIYTYYTYFFILASFILLIAMIGAIVLTMHKGVFVRRQEVFEQNTRDFSKTLIKIKNI